MLKTLVLLAFLQTGDYKERKQAEHHLKLSPITFEVCKSVSHALKDPEVDMRLKRVARNAWNHETREKYKSDYYSETDTMKILQKEHFEKEWSR
tara:strand:- start:74039 stop:74320 length:282 start_codon:yes stop_codon:yes gene_type:complete